MTTQRNRDGFLRVAVVVLGIVLLVPLLLMTFAMPMMGMMWWGGAPTGLSPLWMVGAMAAPLVVLLGLGYLLYRGIAGVAGRGYDPALEELRTAYARGDLTDEEYERRRERLERDRE